MVGRVVRTAESMDRRTKDPVKPQGNDSMIRKSVFVMAALAIAASCVSSVEAGGSGTSGGKGRPPQPVGPPRTTVTVKNTTTKGLTFFVLVDNTPNGGSLPDTPLTIAQATSRGAQSIAPNQTKVFDVKPNTLTGFQAQFSHELVGIAAGTGTNQLDLNGSGPIFDYNNFSDPNVINNQFGGPTAGKNVNAEVVYVPERNYHDLKITGTTSN